MEKYSEENTQYYMDIVKAISEHEDFGQRNPVDLGIECGFMVDDVLRTIERFRPPKTAETGSENISDGGSASKRLESSNNTKNGPFAAVRAISDGLEEITKLYDYVPGFRALGLSEDKATTLAQIIIRANKAGVELNEFNINKLEGVTGYNKTVIKEAIIKWRFIQFIKKEKKLSLDDQKVVFKVREALYSGNQKNDLDAVSAKTGIPLDLVQKMDGILSEFSEKNKIYDSIDRLLKSFDTIPREKRISPEDVAIADMRELVRYLEKQVKGTLQETDRQRIMQKKGEYGKSIELLTEALFKKENLTQ